MVRAALVALLLATAAHAERLVIEEPGVYHTCPKGKTWREVEKCLTSQGRPSTVREIDHAKLVRLDQQESGGWVDGGLYLYVQTKGTWHIAGSWFGRGTDYDLLDMRPFAIGTHTGIRIELGQASPLWVQLDGITSTRAIRRTLQTLYCSGINAWCGGTVHRCEVLVNGNAYWAFHGTQVFEGVDLYVRGDRKLAGPFCAQAERVQLGWPQKP